MKKTLIIILLSLSLLCLFSCGSSAFDNVVAQLDELSWQSSMVYESEQISQIEESIKQAGIQISGEVEGIAHFIKPSYPENTFVYVYEFENSDDAVIFKEQYADKWGTAKIKENVVVYGSATEVIEDLNL